MTAALVAIGTDALRRGTYPMAASIVFALPLRVIYDVFRRYRSRADHGRRTRIEHLD
jgi:hypothetical protein